MNREKKLSFAVFAKLRESSHRANERARWLIQQMTHRPMSARRSDAKWEKNNVFRNNFYSIVVVLREVERMRRRELNGKIFNLFYFCFVEWMLRGKILRKFFQRCWGRLNSPSLCRWTWSLQVCLITHVIIWWVIYIDILCGRLPNIQNPIDDFWT